MFVPGQHKLTSLYIPFTVLKDLSIVLWMCLSLQTVSFKEFSRIVYVFHCSVIKVLICSPSCDSLFTISHHFIDVNSYFLFFSNKKQENGEGGIWTLAPLLTTYSLSRGAPSATWVLLHMPDSFRDDIFKSGEGGIRTHAPFRTNGFQDRLVMTASIPLRASLTETIGIISAVSSPVNHYFHLFLTFFVRFFLLSFTGFLSILSIRITQNLCQ